MVESLDPKLNEHQRDTVIQTNVTPTQPDNIEENRGNHVKETDAILKDPNIENEGDDSCIKENDGLGQVNDAERTSSEKEDEENEGEKILKGILKHERTYSNKHVDFNTDVQLIPYDETKDFTIDIQFVKELRKVVKSYRELFQQMKAEKELAELQDEEQDQDDEENEEGDENETVKNAEKKTNDQSNNANPTFEKGATEGV